MGTGPSQYLDPQLAEIHDCLSVSIALKDEMLGQTSGSTVRGYIRIDCKKKMKVDSHSIVNSIYIVARGEVHSKIRIRPTSTESGLREIDELGHCTLYNLKMTCDINQHNFNEIGKVEYIPFEFIIPEDYSYSQSFGANRMEQHVPGTVAPLSIGTNISSSRCGSTVFHSTECDVTANAEIVHRIVAFFVNKNGKEHAVASAPVQVLPKPRPAEETDQPRHASTIACTRMLCCMSRGSITINMNSPVSVGKFIYCP